MRYKELVTEAVLLEFDDAKTKANFGPKILAAANKDGQFKNQDKNKIIDHVISKLKEADPTSNKQYTLWLIREFTKGVKLEDLMSRGADALDKYVMMRKQNKVPPEYKDLGRVSFSQLENVTAAFNPEQATKQEVNKGKADLLHKGDDCMIIHPKDEAAAKYYGRGTKWCTASNKNNMFNEYNQDGPMFIVIPKHPQYPGEKYQVHTKSRQAMNEQDEEVHLVEIMRRFPIMAKVIPDPIIKLWFDVENGNSSALVDLVTNDQEAYEDLSDNDKAKLLPILISAIESGKVNGPNILPQLPFELQKPDVVKLCIKQNNGVKGIDVGFLTPDTVKYAVDNFGPEVFQGYKAFGGLTRDTAEAIMKFAPEYAPYSVKHMLGLAD